MSVRVLRVIARLNAGGPAHHVGILSSRMATRGFETLLVHGSPARGEPPMADFAQRYPSRRVELRSLKPEVDPRADAVALRRLAGIVRAFRPDIVDTHTAKAGVLGRIAACAPGVRPVVVHTYHGHVLSGYFTQPVTALYRAIETGLARRSDCLVGVSQATVDELVGLRVAPADRFAVVPLGLDLSPFAALDVDAGAVRREFRVAGHDVLATFVGRLVPIKHLEMLLEAVATARRSLPSLRLLVVGDGVMRPTLEARSTSLGLESAVRFAGYRADMAAVAAATDIAVLTSDNEGTPVSLIEASAAGRPSIATAVGGVSDIVDRTTGRLIAPGDAASFARALVELGSDAALRQRLGAAARERVLRRYGADRLVDDVERLYGRLLAGRARASV